VITLITSLPVPGLALFRRLRGLCRNPRRSRFGKRLKEAGSPDVALSVMPGRDHETIIASIGNAVDATREIILGFIATHSVNK
jgi:hypothetical protein